MSTIASNRSTRAARAALSAALLAGGCGWRAGAPPGASFAVGSVSGATVEPGLRAGIEGALVAGLRERGIGAGGPRVDVEIVAVEHTPEAAVGGGTVAWRGRLEVRAIVPERPGCELDVLRVATWVDPGPGPGEAADRREQAVQELARRVADGIVDGLLAMEACR